MVASYGNIHSCHVLFRGSQDEGDQYFRTGSAYGQNRWSTKHVCDERFSTTAGRVTKDQTAGREIVWFTKLEKILKLLLMFLAMIELA